MLIDIEEAVILLKDGEIVAIPTDTVYGLATDMSNSSAVESIFSLKGRSGSNPLVVLIAERSEVYPFLKNIPEGFEKLADAFWPGALTIVMPVNTAEVDNRIRAGLSTTGFRVPDNKDTRDLLSVFGPVVAPSANPSDAPPALIPEDVEKYFGKSFPILHSGSFSSGIPSTIVCYSEGVWNISRRGAIIPVDINSALK